MTIPDFQSIMLPLLQLAADGKEHSIRNAIEELSDQFELTDDEREDFLPSGRQHTFDNRVGWARTYMKKAGLLKYTRRGHFCITDRGREILLENPQYINIKLLKRFPEFVEFQSGKKKSKDDAKQKEIETNETPEELLENSYQELRNNLALDLLDTVKDLSPKYFEEIVVDLLVQMGYGGSRIEAGKAIGKSGDEGIDGIIKEDKLGLDIIYIQAKKWNNNVGRPDIQKFAGALQGKRARKGIFITTAEFSKEAENYVSKIESKIILIDGRKFAELMIDHDVGVSTVASYKIKRIDLDYFTES
ncbi:MAG: restriction endonuclease [Candidatus Krumholzibacteriota bacterium]|nr:restriction endonuclease [Candidatus Krumholzibacteriota bacterium]